MKLLTKVLVGSRLHGLANEKSDYDYRGVHIHPLKDVLSPFKTLKNTDWIEGDTDNTSYELADFCKFATKGNATILEVFFSDKVVETSGIADEMRANWRKFMDTDNFVMALRGYSQNQLNKMELFEDTGVLGQPRTAKFVVAYMRVMWQCAKFLETNKFYCHVAEDEPALRELLLEVKNNWTRDMVPEVTEQFMALQARTSKAWAQAEKMKPDIPWIEDFLYRAYIADTEEAELAWMYKDLQK